jgi:hypothetical protein
LAQPEDWTEWLTIASAVYNNRQNMITKLLPNQILLGYDIQITPATMNKSNYGLAENQLQTMLKRWQQAIEALNQTAGQVLTSEGLYKQGDQVWLKATHLCFPPSENKAIPKALQTFQSCQGDITRGILVGITSIMEHPQHV